MGASHHALIWSLLTSCALSAQLVAPYSLRYSPAWLSFRAEPTRELDQLAQGKTIDQWQWFDGTAVNSNCWVRPLDFSGISMIEQSGQTITLVTPKHGITCKHSIGFVGSETVFFDRNFLPVTNWISAIDNDPQEEDISVVTFTNDFPSTISPFQILPTNFPEYPTLTWSANTTPAEALQYRANTGRMDIRMVAFWFFSGDLCDLEALPQATNWVQPIFTEGTLTDGDSGSPAFLMVDGAPVFLFATHTADPAGPFVSLTNKVAWIQSICGTNYPLGFVSLSRYLKDQ